MPRCVDCGLHYSNRSNDLLRCEFCLKRRDKGEREVKDG